MWACRMVDISRETARAKCRVQNAECKMNKAHPFRGWDGRPAAVICSYGT